MTSITEHNRKQKWKRDACEWCRIHFSVTGYTVGIYDSLESSRKLIDSMIGWWLFFCFHSIQNGLYIATAQFLSEDIYLFNFYFKIMMNVFKLTVPLSRANLMRVSSLIGAQHSAIKHFWFTSRLNKFIVW